MTQTHTVSSIYHFQVLQMTLRRQRKWHKIATFTQEKEKFPRKRRNLLISTGDRQTILMASKLHDNWQDAQLVSSTGWGVISYRKHHSINFIIDRECNFVWFVINRTGFTYFFSLLLSNCSLSAMYLAHPFFATAARRPMPHPQRL